MEQNQIAANEPWLRGTLTDVPAVPRAVLHALELAQEDLNLWAGRMTVDELNQRPFGISSVAFHLRHIARSIDRLLSYAEGRVLTKKQIVFLQTELVPAENREQVFEELAVALDRSAVRVRQLAQSDLSTERRVGSKRLPTTLGGLLVHVAEHTQRHVGQAIVTAKIILSGRTG